MKKKKREKLIWYHRKNNQKMNKKTDNTLEAIDLLASGF